MSNNRKNFTIVRKTSISKKNSLEEVIKEANKKDSRIQFRIKDEFYLPYIFFIYPSKDKKAYTFKWKNGKRLYSIRDGNWNYKTKKELYEGIMRVLKKAYERHKKWKTFQNMFEDKDKTFIFKENKLELD